jgi:hypothetical protein
MHFDLALELVLAEVFRHLYDLGDRRVAADGDGREPAFGARALYGSTDGFADRFRVDDGFFVDGVVGSGLRRIRLNPVLAPRHGQLNELHRRGGYVKSD